MMKNIKYFIALVFIIGGMLFLSFTQQLGAPPRNYDVSLTIEGYADKEIYLGYYFLDKQYILDTAQTNEVGKVRFKGTKNFKPGVFFAATNEKQLIFDFILNESVIDLETSLSSPIASMKINNSTENLLFFNYIKYTSETYIKRNGLAEEIKKANEKQDTERVKVLSEELKTLETRYKKYKDNITVHNPNLLVGKVLKMTEEIPIPAPPQHLTEEEDKKRWSYYYYRKHFFDNFDLNDDRTIRNPIFFKRYTEYWAKWVPQNPDSIIVLIDDFADKCVGSTDIRRFFLIDKTNEYERSKIMGMDKVFAHLGAKYFADKEEASFVDEATRLKIFEKAKRMSYSLIGNKAMNISLPDSSGTYQSLYNIKSRYTLLAFWDPSCSHCAKEVPILVEAYNKLKEKDTKVAKYLEVFSVDANGYSDDNKEALSNDWKEFINKYKFEGIHVRDYNNENPAFRVFFDIQGTPLVFLLDENKTIIAKKFPMDKLEEILTTMDTIY